MPTWSSQDDCLGRRHQVLELLLEDSMRQARNQALVLFGIPSSNRRPNGGDEPYTLHSTLRVDQEEHQGVGGVSTHRRVRLQPCKTFDYRQVPLRGRLRLQPVVPIGHSTSSSTRAHKHGRECPSQLPQEDARRYKKHHRAPSTTTSDQAQHQQATHDIQHWRPRVATPSQGPLPQRTQVQTSTTSQWTLQGACTLQQQRLQDRPPARKLQHELCLPCQGYLALQW